MKKRKISGEKAFKIFFDEIINNKSLYNNNLAFFYSENIQKGITGITATKLSKHTNCPTIVAAKQGKFYTGSIRGKTNYHYVEFLKKSSSILEQFGGHEKAAGFTFHETNLNNFKNFLTNNSTIFSNTNVEERKNNTYRCRNSKRIFKL